MCAKREVVLSPCKGYSEAHVAALEPDLPKLKELFGTKPKQFEEKTSLGGTAWDLLRSRGHALVWDLQGEYPDCIDRQYVSHNIMLADSCQEFMKIKPIQLFPNQERAFKQYLDRKQTGEPDPVEIYEIDQGPLKGEFGARASRNLKPGEFVVSYKGIVALKKSSSYEGLDPEKLEKKLKADSYNHNFSCAPLFINALKKGSWGEMFNHGPPNCTIFEYVDEGIPRIGIMALRAIGAIESLHIDYRRGYFAGRCEPSELAPEAIDRYIEETRNLSHISHFCVGPFGKGEGWTQISVVMTKRGPAVDRKSFSVADLQALPAIHTQAFYHMAMLDYICHFPQRALEHVKGPKGRQFAENWVAIMDYCQMEKQLELLGLTPQEYFNLRKEIQKTLGM
jgi:hypothetical protein